MNIAIFTIIMAILFFAMFLVSGELGAMESDRTSSDASLIASWFLIIIAFILTLANNPYYELEKEVKQLIPGLTKQQLENSGPIIKDLYKEIKLQEYKKKLEKEVDERK